MVLVVAVLGLLAVIGTVYILTARTERNSAAAMSSVVNLGLARDSVMAKVRQTVGASIVDSGTSVPGPPPTINLVGGYGTVNAPNIASRFFDFPERGTGIAGVTSYNSNIPDERWLVQHLHPQVALSAAPTTGINDFSSLNAYTNPYNPATGDYTTSQIPYTNQMTFKVVNDQTSGDLTPDDPPNAVATGDAYMDMLPFSDASGVHYRYGVRILDTNRMANLNTGATDDIYALQDYSGAYPTSFRLAPNTATGSPHFGFTSAAYFSSSDAPSSSSLHVSPGSPSSGLGRAGTSLAVYGYGQFAVDNWLRAAFNIEKPQDTSLNFFNASDELELRSYGEYGTSYHIRAGNQSGNAKYVIWPYTLSADSSKSSSPSTTVAGNPARRNYTQYSFSRVISPFAAPTGAGVFTLSPVIGGPLFVNPPYTGGTYNMPQQTTNQLPPAGNPVATDGPHPTSASAPQVWPANPAGANASLLPSASANPQLLIADPNNPSEQDPNNPGVYSDPGYRNTPVAQQNQNDAMYYVAMAATNIATAMQNRNYSAEEYISFAANYATARWNGFCPDPRITTVQAWYLPAGPSFVDNAGICIRTATYAPRITTSTPLGTPTAANISPIGRDFGTPAGGGPSNPLKTSGLVYLGYSAQPFINEVVIFAKQDPTAPPTPFTQTIDYDDWAVELYNPYPVALSLSGYQLQFNVAGASVSIPITTGGVLGGAPAFIPPYGYLVICGPGTQFYSSANLAGPGTGLGAFQKIQTAYAIPAINLPLSAPPASPYSVVLTRPYYPRGINSQLSTDFSAPLPAQAPVDYADVTNLLLNPLAPGFGATDQEFDISRDNDNGGAVPDLNVWAGTVNHFAQYTGATIDTLGKINVRDASAPTSVSGRALEGVPLDDRFAHNPPPSYTGFSAGVASMPAPPQASMMSMGEFSRVIRLSNRFDPSGVLPPVPISNQLYQIYGPAVNGGTGKYTSGASSYTQTPVAFTGPLITAAPYPTMTGPTTDNSKQYEAFVHFDFSYDPTTTDIYGTSNTYSLAPTTTGNFDLRAIQLLDILTMVDRASDFSTYTVDPYNPLTVTFDLNRLSVPGLINVNTASGDVLRAIPNMTDQMVANILAYRIRSSGPITYGATMAASATYPQATYPGYGIRSFSELMIPLSGLVPNIPLDTVEYDASSFAHRDQAWGSICNLCTVRSDTFAVYGYLEAIRQNPNFTGTFNNMSDWYGTASDDPHNTTSPVIRVARRRWIAIIDRSLTSTGSTLPRIVAIKDLPQ
ncbi:MAG TPA: hypothetical protein VM008_01590 [Phycisphaerae bacterium]|nr:hypothetical protein [Phycisphaerae bacterium]